MHPSPEFRQTVELYRSGLSLSQVGKIMGVSHVAIFQRLKTVGVERRRDGQVRKPVADIALAVVIGATLNDAVAKTGQTRNIVLGRIYARNFSMAAWKAIQPFTREEKAIVREAFDVDGLTFPDVIELINDHRSMGA
jgi:hypothetical protein